MIIKLVILWGIGVPITYYLVSYLGHEDSDCLLAASIWPLSLAILGGLVVTSIIRNAFRRVLHYPMALIRGIAEERRRKHESST